MDEFFWGKEFENVADGYNDWKWQLKFEVMMRSNFFK